MYSEEIDLEERKDVGEIREDVKVEEEV